VAGYLKSWVGRWPTRWPADTTGRSSPDGFGVQTAVVALVSAAGAIVWKHDGWLPVAALKAAAAEPEPWTGRDGVPGPDAMTIPARRWRQRLVGGGAGSGRGRLDAGRRAVARRQHVPGQGRDLIRCSQPPARGATSPPAVWN